MEMNWMALIVASLTTLAIGTIWYNPKVFGTIWMKEAGLSDESMKKGSMPMIIGLTVLYSLMITIIINTIVIHQWNAFAMIGGTFDATKTKPSFTAFMNDYGTAFRSFTHGALHGFMTGVFFALPMIAINSLFERRSWKYILVHGGYWIVTLTIMGAIICGWI
jgi:Protein of unknown function (DUF1761)